MKITLPKISLRFIGWFFFANACLFFLISFSYLFEILPFTLTYPTVFHKILVGLFVAITMVGHFSFLAFLPALLVIPWAFFCKRLITIQIISVIIASCACIFLINDAFVFKQFHYHINGIILQMLFSKEFSEVFELPLIEWILIVGLVLLIIALEAWMAYVVAKVIKKKSLLHGKTIGVILGTTLFFSYEIFLLGGLNLNLSLTQQARAFPLFNNIVAFFIPLPDSLTRVETLASGHFAQLKQVTKPIRYPLKSLHFKAVEKPLNLVVIVIDAWRFDMLQHEVVPNINQFARKTWQFNNHWSGGNCTQTGIFSLFYGIPGTYWASMLEKQQGPLLIKTLLEHGYQTGIYASAELVVPAFHQTAFVNIPHLAIETRGNTPYQRDQEITRKFFNFLDNVQTTKKPFFSFLFYDGAHAYCVDGNPIQKFQPAVATCRHYALSNDTDPVPYLNRYKNALTFVDAEVGKVVDGLTKRGLLKNTVILLTGDHGQEFNDNHCNYWEHAGNYTKYQVRTPLLIYWPHEKPAKFEHLTSHFDITPTLMRKLLGCLNEPKDFSIGHFILEKTPLTHLVISSYVDFGVIESNQITTIYATGNYAVHDSWNRLLANTKLHLSTLREAFQEINRFYEGSVG